MPTALRTGVGKGREYRNISELPLRSSGILLHRLDLREPGSERDPGPFIRGSREEGIGRWGCHHPSRIEGEGQSQVATLPRSHGHRDLLKLIATPGHGFIEDWSSLGRGPPLR
jgi:hypothetical protein